MLSPHKLTCGSRRQPPALQAVAVCCCGICRAAALSECDVAFRDWVSDSVACINGAKLALRFCRIGRKMIPAIASCVVRSTPAPWSECATQRCASRQGRRWRRTRRTWIHAVIAVGASKCIGHPSISSIEIVRSQIETIPARPKRKTENNCCENVSTHTILVRGLVGFGDSRDRACLSYRGHCRPVNTV